MKPQKKILVFAVVIGLLTVIGLSYYIKSLQTTEKVEIPYSKVVVANNVIPANVVVTAEMVTMKSIPSESVHPEAIRSLDKLVGKISKSEIVSGEQILSSRIVVDVNKATLAYRVPMNMRAIAIPNTEVTGVAGRINVGDKIDLLVTYAKEDINKYSTTYTQLQNVEVAAIGNTVVPADDKQKGVPTSITLFVKPAQAEVIAYALANGSIYLTLRNPIDTAKVTDLKFYNSTNFSTYNER